MMPYSVIMLCPVKPFTVLTLFAAVTLCFGQKPGQSLSFSSEDERVTDFVQLPDSALSILSKDREAFPDGMPSDLHCEDHDKLEISHGQSFSAEGCPSHSILARITSLLA
jgi:hypothetical protein